ncbi:GATA transcription factor 19 [Cajanus cajan]|uniref:GATA transcription factor 19 n=1 Tax=Cajanus cajan TaxID=3821 RepID=A0A151TIA8_CAJCA|nr:GATA transcription factor 19 [Cajanus cajan]KYP66768.1 GATA transcription factor 19 [Cajanus cajan]
MHRCCSSGSQGHVMGLGPCTCGMFHTQTSSFSMLFSMPNHESQIYDYSSSPSVDCTLSLGTPSTRFSQDQEKPTKRRSVSNFCWDILQQSKHNNPQSQTKSPRPTNTTDSLLARRCANCDTTSTPLWRNGPRGPKSLCNACGIRFKKEERRASAAAASGGVMESAQAYNNSWYAQQQSQKMQCFSPGMGSEFRFVEDADRDAENGIPFLSWRLNVTDRTSLVHDFTR